MGIDQRGESAHLLDFFWTPDSDEYGANGVARRRRRGIDHAGRFDRYSYVQRGHTDRDG
jgi:hypothetical protein